MLYHFTGHVKYHFSNGSIGDDKWNLFGVFMFTVVKIKEWTA